MSDSALRAHIAERLHLVTLGYFSSVDRVAHQYLPNTTGDPYPAITVVHESIHRDLSVATDLGLFEGLLGFLIAQPATPKDLRRMAHAALEKSCAASWCTHESATTYCSLSSLLADDDNALARYLEGLPPDYRAAYKLYEGLLGHHHPDALTAEVAFQLAKCISQVALNVPILSAFRSLNSISPEAVADFLRSHHPDERQQHLILHLKADNRLVHLLTLGSRFLEDQRRASTTKSAATELTFDIQHDILIMSKLDLFLIDQLTSLFPGIAPRETPADTGRRRLEAWEGWAAEWAQSGLGQFPQFVFHDPAADADPEVDLLLDTEAELSFEAPTPFENSHFTPLPEGRVSEYMQALQTLGSDLFVNVVPNVDREPLELSSNAILPPGHIVLFTWPWSLVSDDRIQKIHAAMQQRSLVQRFAISCPFSRVETLIEALGRVKVVWVRWHDLEVNAAAAGFRLPTLPGWSVLFRISCSGRDILNAGSTLFSGDQCGVFFFGAPGTDKSPQALFTVFVNQARQELHLFPVVDPTVELLAERFAELGTVRRWSHEEINASGLGDLLRDVIAIFVSIA